MPGLNNREEEDRRGSVSPAPRQSPSRVAPRGTHGQITQDVSLFAPGIAAIALLIALALLSKKY